MDNDKSIIDDSGIAFDPMTQHLDLSKEEKRRTTAIMLAINGYRELIIKDADYLREATNNARNNDGPALKPATIDAMIDAAFKFDHFIASGEKTTESLGETTGKSSMTEFENEEKDVE